MTKECPKCIEVNKDNPSCDDWDLCPLCLKKIDNYLTPIRETQKYRYIEIGAKHDS